MNLPALPFATDFSAPACLYRHLVRRPLNLPVLPPYHFSNVIAPSCVYRQLVRQSTNLLVLPFSIFTAFSAAACLYRQLVRQTMNLLDLPFYLFAFAYFSPRAGLYRQLVRQSMNLPDLPFLPLLAHLQVIPPIRSSANEPTGCTGLNRAIYSQFSMRCQFYRRFRASQLAPSVVSRIPIYGPV